MANFDKTDGLSLETEKILKQTYGLLEGSIAQGTPQAVTFRKMSFLDFIAVALYINRLFSKHTELPDVRPVHQFFKQSVSAMRKDFYRLEDIVQQGDETYKKASQKDFGARKLVLLENIRGASLPLIRLNAASLELMIQIAQDEEGMDTSLARTIKSALDAGRISRAVNSAPARKPPKGNKPEDKE